MKKPSGAQPGGSARSLVDMAAVDRLAKIMAQYDLNEIEIGLGDLTVRLARQQLPTATAAQTGPVAANSEQGSAGPVVERGAPANVTGAVKSPMVGTAYLRPSPEAKPFVEVGSAVQMGDKLLLVEAMKTFNDIVAPRAGKVVSILVVDGSPVEYDQPLMIIE
jgi:acetyl-CoA carboxylase biotin carboxyl carrier protein